MLTHEEEVKADVARTLENCSECSDDGLCNEHVEMVNDLQEEYEFDVTGYLSNVNSRPKSTVLNEENE